MKELDRINPYRPGAGHMPPFLAGRDDEKSEFVRLLDQDIILENVVLTGLRGVGKTVLLDTLKPIAQHFGWLWVGTDLSESASLSDANLAHRIIADLSLITSKLTIGYESVREIGFHAKDDVAEIKLTYEALTNIYDRSPGLASDKLKTVIEFASLALTGQPVRGIIFAYDEAQNLSDHAAKEEFPLSLLLDVFQSIQKKGIPFMLVLAGLPTLYPKLVESRTYAERMFRVVFLDHLTEAEAKEAILEPLDDLKSASRFPKDSVEEIIRLSGGYPYFIQFFCRETYDLYSQQLLSGEDPDIPFDSLFAKLDNDFFAGRWARATDRQQDLLHIIAHLDSADDEFTVQEIVAASKDTERPFSSSHVNQMLTALTKSGLIFKNRHGKYAFAVPLLGQYIRRQAIMEQPSS